MLLFKLFIYCFNFFFFNYLLFLSTHIYFCDVFIFELLFFGAMGIYLFLSRFSVFRVSFSTISFFLVPLLASFIVQGPLLTVFAVISILTLFYCYVAMQMVFVDRVTSLFITVILMFGCSLLFTPYIAGIILLCISSVLLLVNKQRVCLVIFDNLADFKKLDRMDIFAWILLLLGIICFGVHCFGYVLSSDRWHSLYEASIGCSFRESFFYAPDFSYAGRVLKYHFFGSQLPFFFANIFSVSYLQSSFFLTRIFLGSVFFFLISGFFSSFFKKRVPYFFFLYMPILINTIGVDTLGGKVTIWQMSFFLGFIWLIFGIYFFLKEKYWALFIVSGLLIVTKASFFLTLLGGIFLFLVLRKNMKKLAFVTSFLSLLFMFLYRAFLKGAHPHNLWVVNPFYILRHPDPWWTKIFLLFIAGMLVFSMFIFWRKRVCLFLVTVSAAGLFGYCWFPELAEHNHIQFYIASYFAISLVIYFLWKFFLLKITMPKLRFFVLSLLWSASLLGAVFHSYRGYDTARWILFGYFKEKHGIRSVDEMQAYMWLGERICQEEIVLYGRHYDLFLRFFEDKGIVRSGLSMARMYCEMNVCKGIEFEKDFPERFANSVHFYRYFVNCSERSQKLLSPFNMFFKFAPECLRGKDGCPFPFEKPMPLSQYNKLLHIISFGREWIRQNQWFSNVLEIQKRLRILPKEIVWASSFLKSNGIGYVVLENGDQPTMALYAITEKIYEKNSVIILKVKRELL